MKTISICLLSGLLIFGATTVYAGIVIPHKEVQFKKGTSGATINSKIKGGQALTVDFKASKTAAYFNILAPSSEALFVGQNEDPSSHYQGDLPADGVYTIRLYSMGAAKASKKDITYTLKVNIAPGKN